MINLRNLGIRFLFALWAVPIAWCIVNVPFNLVPQSIGFVSPGHLLIIALILLACHEYCNMLKIFFPYNAFWLTYVWLILQIVLYLTNNVLPGYLGIYLLLLFVAIEAFFWGKSSKRRRWVRASLMFSGTVFLYIAATSLFSFYRDPFQKYFIVYSSIFFKQVGIVSILTAIFLCDTFAYIVGNIWGRHHFSSISPKKTIEGSIGGFVASVITMTIAWVFFRNPAFPLWIGIVMGVLIGVFAQVGDLLVSLMKRYFRVKDASTLIPGHGGILDRFDSLFFTAPILSLFVWIVNRIM